MNPGNPLAARFAMMPLFNGCPPVGDWRLGTTVASESVKPENATP